MINRQKRNSSRFQDRSSSSCGTGEILGRLDKTITSQRVALNRYKQSKLPIALLSGRNRKTELDFILNEDMSFQFAERDTDKPITYGFTFILQFKWPELKKLVNLICHNKLVPDLNLEYQRDRTRGGKLSPEDEEVWDAILKSHLQKAVRRGKVDEAVATANLMLDRCPIKLLRRLPIIIIEDVCLNRHFGTLIWLMVYYSDRLSRCFNNDDGIVLKWRWRNLILSQVEHLCKEKWQDCINFTSSFQEIDWIARINKISQSDTQKVDDCNLIYAMEIRKLYGGMDGDMHMIDRIVSTWINRIESLELDNLITPVIKDWSKGIPRLTKDNFIIEAIDFHPCPWILPQIKVKTGIKIPIDALKEVMWHSSSSVNYRVNKPINRDYTILADEYDFTWKKIANEILTKYIPA